MNITEIIKKYAHPQSVLNVRCIDNQITLHDLRMFYDTDHPLLIRALSSYETDPKNRDLKNKFSTAELDRLKFLDGYLNIPVLALIYIDKPDYKLYLRVAEAGFYRTDLFDTELLIKDFSAHGGVEELKIFLKAGLFQLNKRLIRLLAEHGKLECIRYAHKQECKLSNSAMELAAKNGHLDCLQYLHLNGCKFYCTVASSAASNGHLDCLKYVHKNGGYWDWETTADAVENGHLECLKYAHENGCDWCCETTERAAIYGQLECLKYLHEHGCPWDYLTTAGAAESGHLDCLKYAYENGCEWDKHTTYVASKNGRLACLKYAYENGCPLDTEACLKTVHGNCREWLLNLPNEN